MLASALDPYYQPVTTALMSFSEVLRFFVYLFISSSTIAGVLLIWMNTNAFVEYARLFGFKMEGYKNDEDLGISYPDYLQVKYNNFIVKLLACPICLSVWFNLAAYFIHGYTWISISGVYVSLIFYFFLKMIMKKSDG